MLKCFLFCMLIFPTMVAAQKPPTKITWRELEDIDFDERYVKEMKGHVLFPKFRSLHKSLNGALVEIKGYVIPVDKDGKYIVLSAYPYASCFFCGKAGPASVLTVRLKTPNQKYRTDNRRVFKGRLRLNATDIREFYYVLEEAVETGRW